MALACPFCRADGFCEQHLDQQLSAVFNALPEVNESPLPATDAKKVFKFLRSGVGRLVANAASTSLLFGYEVGVLNSCSASMALSMHWCDKSNSPDCAISKFYQSGVNSSLFIGAIVGSVLSGYLAHRCGRRAALQVCCVAFFLGGVLASVADGIMSLVISRILSGIGLGLATVVTPLYISEMTPPQTRGFYGTFHQVAIGLGIFLSISFGLPLELWSSRPTGFNKYWWRVMLGVVPATVAGSAFLSLTLVFPSETPQWLSDHDRTSDALSALLLVHDTDTLEHVEEHLLGIFRASEEAKGLSSGITFREAAIEPYYRHALLLGLSLAALQQVTGINVVISSSNDMFIRSGIDKGNATLMSTIMAFCNMVATIIAAPFVESRGRRTMLAVGLLGQGISLVPCGFLSLVANTQTFDLSPVVVQRAMIGGVVSFVTFFSFTVGPVVWIYLSEIYPVEVRGMALSGCGVCNWITSFLVVSLGRFVPVGAAFDFFSAMSFLGLYVVLRFVIETKGSSLHDSPMCPRSGRSDCALIMKRSMSCNSNLSMNDLRTKLRHSSSPNISGLIEFDQKTESADAQDDNLVLIVDEMPGPEARRSRAFESHLDHNSPIASTTSSCASLVAVSSQSNLVIRPLNDYERRPKKLKNTRA